MDQRATDQYIGVFKLPRRALSNKYKRVTSHTKEASAYIEQMNGPIVLITLQLNPKARIDKNIIRLLSMIPATAQSTSNSRLVGGLDYLLITHCQWLLKAEWEKVKFEAAGPVRACPQFGGLCLAFAVCAKRLVRVEGFQIGKSMIYREPSFEGFLMNRHGLRDDDSLGSKTCCRVVPDMSGVTANEATGFSLRL